MADSGIRWRVEFVPDAPSTSRAPHVPLAGSAFQIPARFQVRCHAGPAQPLVALDVAIENGVAQCRSVRIDAWENGDALDAKAIRIPLPSLLDRAVDAALDAFGGETFTGVRGHEFMRVPAAPSALAARPRRRRPMTEQHLEEVARIYNGAVANGEAPVVAVMGHFNLKGESARRNAHRWIKSARDRRLIPPKETEQ